jgi:TonB-linked SusC/RagA family outer membrane protein
MNGTEFAEFYNAYDIASGADPADVFYNGSSALRPLPSDVGEGTDWVGEISGTGIIENHQLTFSSGSETSRTSVSLNYLDHDGIVKGGSYDRLGVRLANQMDVTPWLSTAVNLFVTREDQTSSGSVISEAIRMSPALSIYNEDGTYAANNLPAAQGLENPIATANEVTNETKNWDIIGNFELTLKPFKNFNFKTSIGGDFNNFKYGFYNPSTTITGGLLGGEATIKNSNTSHFVNSNIFSYNNVFNDKHRVDVIAGMTYEEQTYEDFSVTASDFFTDAFLYNNIDAAGLFGVPESSKEQWQLLSYLGRVNYGFDSKYLVSASARYDGSSRFGEGNKWGFFPAVSGGWIVSSEDFMANSKDVINNLKLRAGWAITGNQDIGLQKSLAVFNVANYPVGTSIESGVSASRLANGDLKWEETASINVGLDLRLFNRVSLAMDYYEKTTTDLLLDVALVETSGFSTALLNTGELQNKGFEISVNTNVINNENFKFNLKTDLFLNKSEIISLVGDATQEWRIGNPLGAARGYVSDGIIQNQEELDAYSDENGIPINGLTIGEERAVDQNGDGVIDLEDQVITFDPNPDFSYAISPSFSYKNLSLDLFFYGVQGNQIKNNTASLYRNVSVVRTNISADVVNNYWTPENTDANYPRLAGTNNFHTQRLNIEDGSFLRLQNIRFGYTLPKLLFFESASVYFSAQNVFTITKYSGFDPDISSIDSDGDLVIGEDNNSYPLPKSYTLGLQVNF